MTANERLAEIKARAEAAAEGPWLNVGLLVCSTTTHEDVADTVVEPVNPQQLANADFIAHARTDVPALVGALEAVLKVIQQHRALSVEYTPDFQDGMDQMAGDIEVAITEALGVDQ